MIITDEKKVFEKNLSRTGCYGEYRKIYRNQTFINGRCIQYDFCYSKTVKCAFKN